MSSEWEVPLVCGTVMLAATVLTVGAVLLGRFLPPQQVEDQGKSPSIIQLEEAD